MGQFEFKIDEELTDIFFIKDDEPDFEKLKNTILDDDDRIMIKKKEIFLKKNYLMVTHNKKIKFKNLVVKKKSTSAITRKIFFDLLVPKIIEERKMKFPELFLQGLVYQLLNEDISLAAVRYAVKREDIYKNSGQLQAQISHIYGPGIHLMVPIKRSIYDENNKVVTAGKDKKYISLENFKKFKLTIQDLDLSNVWSELAYFIKNSQTSLAAFF